ncbi:outer membrane autotransporter barrel domain-containing protein [Parelusimicrobium proximum]|uniref:autotransporter domain-containing protein n=1 Tax=Parelusimicrobium proximum TaxID=3228953 RepID=UPI003D174826
MLKKLFILPAAMLALCAVSQAQTLGALLSDTFISSAIRPEINRDRAAGLYNRLDNRCGVCSNAAVWGEGFLGREAYDSDMRGAGDFKNKKKGVSFGVDKYFNSLGLTGGIYGSYTDRNMSQKFSKADVASYELGIYGGLIKDNWDIKGLLAFNYNDYDIKKAYSKVEDFGTFGLITDVEAGYNYALPYDLTLRPFAGFNASVLHNELFRDRVSNTIYTEYRSDNQFSAFARTGVGITGKYNRLSYSGAVEYNYIFKGHKRESDVFGYSGTLGDYKVSSAKLSRSVFGLTTGAGYDITDSLNIFANLEYRLSSEYENISGGIGLRYAFCGYGCYDKSTKSRSAAYTRPRPSPVRSEPAAEQLTVQYIPVTQTEYAAAAVQKPLPKVGHLYFNPNIMVLGPNARNYLTYKSAEIKSSNYKSIIVTGYTDGSETVYVAQERAKAVSNYLIANGIPANRINTRGVGIAPNASSAGAAEARRVEVFVR